MKKQIVRSLVMATAILMQCTLVYASSGAANLQNFLNGYVARAGQIVCIFGAVEIVTSFSSQSFDKKFRGLRIFGMGLVLTSINSIINTILK